MVKNAVEALEAAVVAKGTVVAGGTGGDTDNASRWDVSDEEV